ncbi:hypothetical protein F2Q68_00035875 [Brassica cretica]|uniref:NYN domain-containing protein n=1 Tax=Brassica cretica TaxID=69181 RepID=A0A8S9H209_BRACR|nr:hypothetical protein F2Q68_00035875 [Brassica cretica]
MPHQIFSNHMPRISREEAIGFFGGLASLYNHDFDMSQIHVFWDVRSCPIDISIILPVLREKGYHGRVLFRPYLPYQGDEPLLGYRDDGYARVPSIKVEGDAYAAIARMLLDILFWAMNHDDLPQNLILISQPSKDIDIVIQALERRGFNIVFKPSDDEVASHTINDSFESLCKSPPDTANQTLLESPCRMITDVSRKLKRSLVIIFWLVDSCPSNPYEFHNKFSSTLEDKGYADYESVTAYVEEGKNSDEVINVCRKSGLQVRLAPEGDEFGKFSLMLLDMINWTQASGAPFNFLQKPLQIEHPVVPPGFAPLFPEMPPIERNMALQYISHSDPTERQARITRVQQSFQPGFEDNVGRAPRISHDINKGKGHVFNFQEQDRPGKRATLASERPPFSEADIIRGKDRDGFLIDNLEASSSSSSLGPTVFRVGTYTGNFSTGANEVVKKSRRRPQRWKRICSQRPTGLFRP